MKSLTTIVAPLRQSHVAEAEARIDALHNPARDDIRAALDILDENGDGTHFMSLHAIDAGADEEAHLVLEFTADGDERRAVERIAAAIGSELRTVFEMARDWRSDIDLAAYLLSHRISVGAGLGDNPGLPFAGTPGMTVGRIRAEADLAKFVAPLVDDGVADLRPIDRLARIRRTVASSDFAWALEPPPPPLRDGSEKTVGQAIVGFLPNLAATFLWPLGLLLVAAAFLFALIAGWDALWLTPLTGLVLLALFAGLTYARLRRQEETDWVDETAPQAATLAGIRARENHCAQNHMVSITVRKPGFVRWLTLRLAFWIIGMMASRVYRPGFLGGISTIHAARWITIPGTRKLIFFSNFGGSWESYLEDFITRAHGGLTAVWSNSIGFPKAKNLFQQGATDGERFKRYARASMKPTLFWYSAYPHLITDHVRCNAAMRRGLAAALTNDEAKAWLALFGSAPRPDSKLESNEIQSLAFGGLGFMPHGACLIFDLPADREKARAFAAGLYPHTAFGDGRKLRRDAVLLVGFGPAALEKLGLPPECIRGFPAAFLEGMTAEGRRRILGDIGVNDPAGWQWGQTPPDVALLVYGRSETDVSDLVEEMRALGAANGAPPPHLVPLAEARKPAMEPFGFVDGVSQPIIRGSYQSYRNSDPIHLVEPGEFIVGYPDNRGNFPPEPELSPLADPDNLLPIADRSREFGNSIVDAPRAIGRNGSFLVLRQLEQDVPAFWQYCANEAERMKDRFPQPYEVTKEFIAAKLVGRWPDGSSLVRNPYYAHRTERVEAQKRHDAREPAKPDHTEIEPPVAENQAETLRPPTNPAEASPIPPPVEPSRRADNDFLYGTEDPQAMRCPFGAHIRRANPRDSLMPGSMEQVSISNRHRIMRVGRLYRPQDGEKPGLMFMCLNGDIERQFEFIQQTWLISPSFHGLTGEQDPLTSDASPASSGYLMPSHDGPKRLKPLPRFVRVLGGGYFFMPSRSLLNFLAGARWSEPGAVSTDGPIS